MVVYNTAILMPRFFSVVQSAGLIGDWHRGEIFPKLALFIVLRQPALLSSATPSETKNTYFCGAPAVPAPGRADRRVSGE